MAGPADQAAANTQALAETLAAAALIPIADAETALTADDWTVATGSLNDFVYEAEDTTWDALFDNAPTNVNPPVYNNRSGPLSAPYGGGWEETQYED